MKKKNLIFAILILILIIFFIYNYINREKQDNTKQETSVWNGMKTNVKGNQTFTTLQEIDEVLINPGKGWVLYEETENEEMGSVFYERLNWSQLEPNEGEYNWSLIDDKIEECKKKGKKYAFGVMNANTSWDNKYITPKWVFDEGAEGREVEVEFWYNHLKTVQVIPVWTDKIFLEKLNNFTKALAERYDGNENIAFIDIRSYGNWGEQHLSEIGGEEITKEQLKDLYLTPYISNFKKTKLVTPCGNKNFEEIYDWAIEQGVALRRDGIMGNSKGEECVRAYGKQMVVYEYYGSYAWMKENDLWSQEKLIECINIGKPSYMQFSQSMYNENKEFCEMLANKMGYYFRLKEAHFKNNITIEEEEHINLKFINEGVAPLYEDCTVYIGLLDEEYNLVKKYKTEIDPHTWMPDEEKTETIDIKFDDIETGKYIISLGLFLNENDENPTYLLGNSGKTDNKWYVFGEIQINEPEEQYEITLPNDDYYINNIHSYNVDIDIKNMHDDSEYSIERYIDNSLVENMKVNNDNKECHQTLQFNFKEGENSFKIVIKKDDEVVYEKEKTIYVYSAEDNLKNTSNTALEKYTEFEEKFVTEITKVEGLQDEINSLKQYMLGIASIQKESETITKQKMQEHFDLGNQILETYKHGKLDIEYVKLSSMLDMLNDIGNSYEDLVTVSSVTRDANLQDTKTQIDTTEQTINSNSDLEIIYPTKILEFSKDLYEKAEYIYNLEEENDIKTGLIVSYNLHAKYLADWANAFTNLYIDKYIDNNPVTESYSETNFTNKDVIVTLNIGEDTKITNNEGKNTYTFKANGTFTFEYERRGRQFKKTITIENIDKVSPTIKNIENNKVYSETVRPVIKDDNISSIVLTLNNEPIENYQSGDEIIKEGKYKLVAKDKAGNQTEMIFYIIKDQPVIIEDKIINIEQQTQLEDFKNDFTTLVNYKIIREEKEITEEDIIHTGDILEDSEGKQYTLIVAGDIDGDGTVTVNDYSMLRRYILRLNELDDIQKASADVDIDFMDISVADYSKMRNIILRRI